MGKEHSESIFQKMENQFISPEEVNNSSKAVFFKQIKEPVSGYNKFVNGLLATKKPRFSAMRSVNKLFDSCLKNSGALSALSICL